MKRPKEIMDRFFAKINKNAPNGCWEWTGWLCNGYGIFTEHGTTIAAHRFSYKMFNGSLDGLLVCHKCDNTVCVNPDHLFLGTQKQNMEDMVSKGRQNKASGERCARSKLTKATVDNIKLEILAGLHDTVLMKKYNVSRGCIQGIRHKRTWK